MTRRATALIAGMVTLVLVAALAPLGQAAASPRRASVSGRKLGLKPSKPPVDRRFKSRGSSGGRAIASSVDLSADAPPIKNQGSLSSCAAFSTGYYAKSWMEKVEHPSWDTSSQQHQFSPSFVYNQINGGTDGGASLYDAFQLLADSGDCDWSEFPYDTNYTKQPDSTDRQAAAQYKISSDWGYFFVNSWSGAPYAFSNDVSQLKTWLSAGHPIVLGLPVFSDFPDYGGNAESSYYLSNDSYSSGQLEGLHGVFIAGYDDNAGGAGKGGFLVLNSWGPGWNGNGKVWLSYKFVQKWALEAWYFNDLDSTPVVSNLGPNAGGTNTLVTISGNNFGALRRSARVSFQDASSASVVSWTNSQVKVRVPKGATNGNVDVYAWDGESSNGRQYNTDGTPVPNWLLAEGATWPGFDEWVLVQNPNGGTSHVTLTFMTGGGQVPGPSFAVGAYTRVSVHVNDYVTNQDVSTAITVTSGPNVCAERAMYFNAPDGKWGSHDSIGASSTSQEWYLAEGATWPGYDEWVQVLNPGMKTVRARLYFQTPKGQIDGPTLTLGPQTRKTVHVNDYVANQDVSTEVRSLTSGQGIVAERSMYMHTADGKVDCHDSIGATEPNSGWGLAEGATLPGYEEWVLVENPTGSAAATHFFFMNSDKVIEGPVQSVKPGQRVSVRVNDYMPDSEVSTLVLTESDSQKVVVERAMYIRAPDGKLGAHNSVGSSYSSTGWYLPEGCTSSGYDEWVLVMNPSPDTAVSVQLTFMTTEGAVPGPGASLPPASRKTFHVNDYVTGDVSTRVESDGYVVAERSMYINGRDGKAGAHNSLGLMASYVDGSGAGAASPRSEEISTLRSEFLGR